MMMLLLCDVDDLSSLSSAVARARCIAKRKALFFMSPSKHFPKEKKVSKTPHYSSHYFARKRHRERDDDDDAREMRAPALMMGTPITDAADGGGGGGVGQLPVAPLPDGLKDAPEETQQRYFKEAKRVAIEKCRTHRCGNDEVTAKTHLGSEMTEDALLGRAEWKRPSLTACTAQEFAYDFFKFHENRGEFDYESLWECVFSLARRSSFCLWRFRDAGFYRSSFSRTTTTNGGFMWSP